MKKDAVLTLILLLACFSIQAQPGASSSPDLKPSSHIASLDIQAPAGVFARSQFAGASLNYSWSHHRYGMFAASKKWLGLTVNAGADYYFGKKIRPAGYDFRFDNYLDLYAMAGVISNPWTMSNISLTAGPVLGIYKGNSTMGFGAILSGMYYLKNNIAIGPGIALKKHPDADALWSGLIRLSYIF
jgi:hypothetical protein